MIVTASTDQVLRRIERLLRPPEVAELLSVSRRTVYALINRGDLRACRIGVKAGTIRVHPADLEEFLSKLRQSAGQLPAEQPSADVLNEQQNVRTRESS